LLTLPIKNEYDILMKFSFKTYPFKYHFLLLALLINIGLVFSVHANMIIKKIEEQEHQLGARIGVSIYDVTDNKLWSYNDKFAY